MTISKIQLFLIFTTMLYVCGCTKQTVDFVPHSLIVNFTGQMEDGSQTRTHYNSATQEVFWRNYDNVGVTASYFSGGKDVFTDNYLQHFCAKTPSSESEYLGQTEFTGKLTDYGAQTYTFYCLSPYSAFSSTSDIQHLGARLQEYQFPETHGWDGRCDYQVAKPVTLFSESIAAKDLTLQFSRLFGVLRLGFTETVLSVYGEETVETVSIQSDNSGDVLAGGFTVDLKTIPYPDPAFSDDTSSGILLDYKGRNIKLSEIEAFFVINPGEYENVTVIVETANHKLTFKRSNLSIKKNVVTRATITSVKAGDSVSEKSSFLPRNPEYLNILVIGHSYDIYSLQYIDELLQAANIKNVTYANIYQGDCSVTSHWNNVQSGKSIEYYKVKNGQSTQKYSKTYASIITDENWDVIVFHSSLGENGFYSQFDPNLRKLIAWAKENCPNKDVVTAWHMFWPHATWSTRSSFIPYGKDQEVDYQAQIDAAKELIRKGEVDMIVPTGTAMQSLRHSCLNNKSDFTFDGYHCDYGGGSYATACTWFESFVTPCFGISCYGNPFVPDETSTTYADAFKTRSKVQVTWGNRLQLQRAAINAVANKFEIMSVGKPDPTDPPVPPTIDNSAVNDSMIQDNQDNW